MSNSLPSVTADAAFFIDFDGTLVEIADQPHLVRVEPRVRHVLAALKRKFGDAVAILTGRPLAVVDGFLAPLALPTGAEHGSVRRDAAGRVHRDFEGGEALDALAVRLGELAKAHDGLIFEKKESSAALHYRQRPELAALCEAAVEDALKGIGGVHLLRGKMVLEIKAEGLNKGLALEAFMREEPFSGRVPVMIGDDTTDEFGFAAANGLGGLTIKIGEGETAASHRASRENFLDWLEAQAETEAAARG